MNPVIWFNTWFSAITITIKSIKKEFTDAYIIGTNKSEDCVYKDAVDEFYTESGYGDEYVLWAIDFCKRHKISIFFPKYNVEAISRNLKRFSEIGVTVICESTAILELFKSKSRVYERLKKENYSKIPNYAVVHNKDEFQAAYSDYSSVGYTVCCKYDQDEGASSFRVVSDSFLVEESMHSTLENILSLYDMNMILGDCDQRGKFRELMVMPKLTGPEISVDCYKSTLNGFVAIPRYKIGNRIKEIKLDKGIIEDCKELQSLFGFKYGFNVQYRWTKSGDLMLLEINPRISGGIHLSSLSGFNIVNQILADVLKIQINQSLRSIKEVRVSQYETPVILQEL